jgi:hypothetical protein
VGCEGLTGGEALTGEEGEGGALKVEAASLMLGDPELLALIDNE